MSLQNELSLRRYFSLCLLFRYRLLDRLKPNTTNQSMHYCEPFTLLKHYTHLNVREFAGTSPMSRRHNVHQFRPRPRCEAIYLI